MKKFLLTAILLAAIKAWSQITPEHTYAGYTIVAHLEFQDDKYAVLDAANNRCKLYNADHSLYKSVSLPVPSGYTLNSIQYVTDGLFNPDNLIELSFTSYISTGSAYVYENRVADENGQVLVSIPGASTVLVDHQEENWKYMAWIYDYSSYPYQVDTKIFSLPGHMITAVDGTKPGRLENIPYPNPAMDFVTLPYKLTDVSGGRVLIFNESGQLVREKNIGPDFENVLLPLNGLPAGLYFYHTEGGTGEGRFVVKGR